MNITTIITGILGITFQMASTIMVYNKVKLDTSALKTRFSEKELKEFNGRDAYVNTLKQVEDSAKHTNEVSRVNDIGNNWWLIAAILGAILQGVSLVSST